MGLMSNSKEILIVRDMSPDRPTPSECISPNESGVTEPRVCQEVERPSSLMNKSALR